LQQSTDGNTPESAMGNFLTTYQFLSVHLKEDAPSDALENPMGPRRLALRMALDDLAKWRSNAERTLVELRRKLTP
jgi:hypothetical protein